MLSHAALLRAEFVRTLIISRRYWVNLLSGALSIYLVMLVMMFAGAGFAGGVMDPEIKASVLVGMMAWQLSLGAVSLMGWSFFNEAATGTLEHLYLSPKGVGTVLLTRTVASFAQDLVVMMISAGLAMLTLGVRLELPLLEMVILVPLTVAGVYGFGFLFAAMTLTFKRTQQFLQLFQFFFMIFTGAMVPLDTMPAMLRAFCQIWPMTAGIQALRQVTVQGDRLGDLWLLVGQMTLTAAAWLVVGLFVFRLADRRARLKGSIGQY